MEKSYARFKEELSYREDDPGRVDPDSALEAIKEFIKKICSEERDEVRLDGETVDDIHHAGNKIEHKIVLHINVDDLINNRFDDFSDDMVTVLESENLVEIRLKGIFTYLDTGAGSLSIYEHNQLQKFEISLIGVFEENGDVKKHRIQFTSDELLEYQHIFNLFGK